jgi:hypothetical protein
MFSPDVGRAPAVNLEHPQPSGADPPAMQPQTSEDAGTEKTNETRREKVTPRKGGRKASIHLFYQGLRRFKDGTPGICQNSARFAASQGSLCRLGRVIFLMFIRL